MNYATIKPCDIANGPGIRVSLFVSGCTHRCKGCFNQEAWDFDYGQPFTQRTIYQILSMMAPAYIKGLTLLGGEPFEPCNQRALLPLLRRVRERYPHKSVWAFSGFTLEEELLADGSHPRCEATDEMLSLIDVLVEGRFILAQKDLTLKFRGSRNQRIVDMARTRACGKITLWDEGRRGI